MNSLQYIQYKDDINDIEQKKISILCFMFQEARIMINAFQNRNYDLELKREY